MLSQLRQNVKMEWKRQETEQEEEIGTAAVEKTLLQLSCVEPHEENIFFELNDT